MKTLRLIGYKTYGDLKHTFHRGQVYELDDNDAEAKLQLVNHEDAPVFEEVDADAAETSQEAPRVKLEVNVKAPPKAANKPKTVIKVGKKAAPSPDLTKEEVNPNRKDSDDEVEV